MCFIYVLYGTEISEMAGTCCRYSCPRGLNYLFSWYHKLHMDTVIKSLPLTLVELSWQANDDQASFSNVPIHFKYVCRIRTPALVCNTCLNMSTLRFSIALLPASSAFGVAGVQPKVGLRRQIQLRHQGYFQQQRHEAHEGLWCQNQQRLDLITCLGFDVRQRS